MHLKTLAEISIGLQKKQYSSEEITRHFLNRIETLDKNINSYITVTAEHAIQEAKKADERIARGEASPLTGIPIAQKDIFCTEGVKTSCGSKMLDNFISPYDATTVSRLKEAGCIMLGKTNMDEFAMGSSNETSYYGECKNPWNIEMIPGGSSGGSAAAVAARLAPAATGTDTGGSIRQPAAFCGITGLKPTYGRTSRYGMIAFASSLDNGGPMTQTAEDAALLLNAMAGYDEKDSTTSKEPVPDYTATLSKPLKGLKIGLPKEYFAIETSEAMGKQLEATMDFYKSQGATFVDINLPHTHLAAPSYYIIAPAECSSNLSRYDGVRYGYRCENPSSLEDLYVRSRSEGFGEEVQRRIIIGTHVLSSSSYDAYYLKAQKARRLIQSDFVEAFKQVDFILTPTTPTAAFKVGEKSADPLKMYESDVYTVAASLAGIPAITAPNGFNPKGLPTGFQLIGNFFEEALLLNAVHVYQQETDWHKHCPEAFK